jgi:putative aldouronate transport system substrate-binding protein
MPVTTSLKYNDECCTAVNANCSEDTIKTILTFIDYFYSDEGQILANYGVEGESFETEADGSRKFIVDYSTEESTPAGEKRWSFLSDRLTVCKPVIDAAFFQWNAPLIAEAAGRLLVPENLMTSYVLKFTEDQSKELSNLVASVYDAEMAGVVSFIDGDRELTESEWAAFQDEMNSLGLSRIEEIQLAAYQATYGG